MTSLIQRTRDAIGGALRSAQDEALWTQIGKDGEEFTQDQDYFEIRIDRIALAYDREWLTRYAPVLLTVAEFSYGRSFVARPVFVGPSLVEQHGVSVPDGMVFANTRVAGPHPFRGNELAVTVVLYRVERGRLSDPFLDALEVVTKSLEVVSGLAPVTGIARLVVTGIDAAFGGDRPLIGRRDAFEDPRPGTYALIGVQSGLQKEGLSIENGTLHHNGAAVEGRNYVLYTIRRVAADKIDTTTLPFHPLLSKAVDAAQLASDNKAWEHAKELLAAAVRSLRSSNDVSERHKDQIFNEWLELMTGLRQQAIDLANLEEAEPYAVEDELERDVLAVLSL